MNKYYANSYQGSISPVEISKETKTGVWLHGNRLPKSGYGHSYHDTLEQAHEELIRSNQSRIDNVTGEIARYQGLLEKASSLMGKIQLLKKP